MAYINFDNSIEVSIYTFMHFNTKPKESGHLEVAMNKLGHVLFYANSDPNGLWIHQSVAELLDEKAMTVKEKVGFFQAVKSRLIKFDTTSSKKSGEEIETAIRQVIDESLVSKQALKSPIFQFCQKIF